MFALCDGTDTT